QQVAAAAAAGRSSHSLLRQQPQFVPDPNNPGGFYVIYGYALARFNLNTGMMEPVVSPSSLPLGASLAFIPNSAIPTAGAGSATTALTTGLQQIAQAATQPPHPHQQPAPAATATAVVSERSAIDMTAMNEMRGKMKEEQKPRSLDGSSTLDVVRVGMDRHHRPSGIILPPLLPSSPLSSSSFRPLATSTPAMSQSLIRPKKIPSNNLPKDKKEKKYKKEKEETGEKRMVRLSTRKATEKRAAEAQPGGETDRVQALKNELLKQWEGRVNYSA
ncbi:hypothetical protein PENTCL1PPCAC_17216, partial [Pristionchus entomophagus]